MLLFSAALVFMRRIFLKNDSTIQRLKSSFIRHYCAFSWGIISYEKSDFSCGLRANFFYKNFNRLAAQLKMHCGILLRADFLIIEITKRKFVFIIEKRRRRFPKS